MPKYIPRKGDIIEIEFWDHMEDHDDACLFKIWGRLYRETAMTYSVMTWGFADPNESGLDEGSCVRRFTILKSTVTGIRKLGEG